jgi:hypothetical protein
MQVRPNPDIARGPGVREPNRAESGLSSVRSVRLQADHGPAKAGHYEKSS